jgi:hypothetical protein
MVETDFYTAISTATAVTAICETRVYPAALPDTPTLPAIDYRIIAGSNTPTFKTRGNQRHRFEVNCWSNTYLEAVTLRNAVVTALSGYTSGSMSISYLMNQDFFNDELRQYRAVCEFYVLYNG